MSVWEIIEEALREQEVAIAVGRREFGLVQEVLTSIIRSEFDESASAWPVLEKLMEGSNSAVKGLNAREVEVVKQHPEGKKANMKMGASGMMVVSMPNEAWAQVKQELEANKNFYNILMGGGLTVDGLIDKIGGSLRKSMGGESIISKQGSDPTDDIQVDVEEEAVQPGQQPQQQDPKQQQQSAVTPAIPAAGGTPPAAPPMGTAPVGAPAMGQTGGGSPFASKVHQQDVASMQGAGGPKMTVQDPSQQQKEPGMEDPMSWFSDDKEGGM